MIVKIKPLTDWARNLFLSNLDKCQARHKEAGDAVIADIPDHLEKQAFNGVWAGDEANIKAENVTDWDESYLAYD